MAVAERTLAVSTRRGRWWWYAAAVLGLAAVQLAVSLGGGVVAGWIPLSSVDPGNWWLRLSVHHVVQVLPVLGVMVVVARRSRLDLRLDFGLGLGLGDWRWGLRAVGVVSAVLVVYLVGVHMALRALGHPLSSTVPVDPGARAGQLAFQLLLSGPSEELVFRALPIAVLAALGSVVVVRRWGLRLEALVAAVLFSLAHVTVTLGTWQTSADGQQLAFALVLGAVQGVVFQRSRSVLYPMAIHSISNVIVTVVRIAGL
ncbi:lysostaphin resistance A-like protein [Cellulomonas sp. P22]|uniref:lysostaphin resistance A-like protein n=1 Tax=Cellulomonas sp. P22 TaxID=3373189 RepID=UPI00378FFC7D